MPDETVVRRAGPADLPTLQRMLGRAFADDPVWSWVIKKRPLDVRIGVFLGIATQVHIEHDSVWMTADGSSAAIWAPPKQWRVSPRRIARHIPRAIRAGGLSSLRPLGALGETEKRHPPGEHWYLAALGTDPDARGQGRASAVMAPVLETCDREGLGAYLESSKEENIAFYNRHGFDVAETIHLRRNGPTLWTMWRDPQPIDPPEPLWEPHA